MAEQITEPVTALHQQCLTGPSGKERGEAVDIDGASTTPPAITPHRRLPVLDGWRALSIMLVLAGHLLPLGPTPLHLNGAAATMGMALFFILSGFLITRALDGGIDLRVFLIRRLFRIVPLAWVASLIILIANRADAAHAAAALLFYSNLPPVRLLRGGHHLWSLALEMQFYLGVALLVALGGRRALLALPLLALATTGARILTGSPLSVVTWFRVDEILAGATLALAYGGRLGPQPMDWLGRLPTVPLIGLLVLVCADLVPGLAYFRPYVAALTVGSSLVRPPALLARTFESRAAAYIADISYALYVIHGLFAESWLGEAPHKYLKRPFLFALTFALAHLSTTRFERPCIALAKRLTRAAPRHGSASRDAPNQ